MEPAELTEAIMRYRKTGAQADLLAVWNGCKRFAFRILKRYGSTIEREDGQQEAFIAMLDALKTYNEAQAGFLTWYGYYLFRRFDVLSAGSGSARIPLGKQSELRKAARLQGACQSSGVAYAAREKQTDLQAKAVRSSVSLFAPVKSGKKESLTVSDMLADPRDRIEELLDAVAMKQVSVKLWQMVDRLPADQSLIVHMYYQSSLTLQELADELHSDLKTVRRAHVKALDNLRKNRNRLKPYLPEDWDLFTRGTRWASPEELYVLKQESKGRL